MRQRRGFTLIEAAMTTVIIGVGVVAMVEAQQAFMRSNNWSSQASTGAFLANEIREMTRFMPKHDPVTGLEVDTTGGSSVLSGWGFEGNESTVDDLDDIDDFDGLAFSYIGNPDPSDGDLPGPVDAFGNVIPEIDWNGDVVQDGGVDEPMQGWVQQVTVEPIMPFDTSDVMTLATLATDPEGIGVSRYPLRVTVTLSYQGLLDPQPEDVTDVEWIVP